MSNPPAACCVSGVKHEGDPVGEIKEIGGVKSYVSYPSDKSTKNAILFLPDAFGLEFVNNKLLADDFARAGYFTVIPDIFEGEPVPFEMLLSGVKGNFDIMAWVGRHPISKVDPIVENTIKGMKELGTERIGAVGYCFGGKYVVRFLAEGRGVDAGYVAHPSFVDKEEIEASKGPLSIAAAETDQVFPAPKRHETEELLQKLGNPYQIVLYGATEHGFAVRTDLKDPKKKFAKESAYFQAVRWFDQWVKE